MFQGKKSKLCLKSLFMLLPSNDMRMLQDEQKAVSLFCGLAEKHIMAYLQSKALFYYSLAFYYTFNQFSAHNSSRITEHGNFAQTLSNRSVFHAMYSFKILKKIQYHFSHRLTLSHCEVTVTCANFQAQELPSENFHLDLVVICSFQQYSCTVGSTFWRKPFNIWTCKYILLLCRRCTRCIAANLHT